MKLEIDEGDLATCVSCGLCLPHCPTFRVTGEEALSPRGRIAAMRAVHNDAAPVTDDFISFMETCVQCRGCEPACPSGVHYGRLQEGVRATLATRRRITPLWQRLAYSALPRHRLLLIGSTLLAAAQRFRLAPHRLSLARLPLRRGRSVEATGTDVWLFTGCVMDAWQRATHRNTAKVLTAMGVTFAIPESGGGCCGALHTHAGLMNHARRLAKSAMSSMPGDGPIVVNSAGCGAAMKEYAHLLSTPEAAAFSERVVDINEFVATRIDRLGEVRNVGRVVVHDPCHLRHVQGTHLAVRTVLAGCADVVELDDDGLCCGAGGSYSATQPELARQIRDRKLESIARAGGGVVASANPGCSMFLADAGIDARHPIDVLADAL